MSGYPFNTLNLAHVKNLDRLVFDRWNTIFYYFVYVYRIHEKMHKNITLEISSRKVMATNAITIVGNVTRIACEERRKRRGKEMYNGRKNTGNHRK